MRILFKIYNFVNRLLLRYKVALVYYYYYDNKLLNLINEERYKNDLLLTVNESLQLYHCAKSALKIKGDFAEVGVYRGGSALIIAKTKLNKRLYLFDTFEGLPKTQKIDKYVESKTMIGQFEGVRDKLKNYPKIFFYKGLFPDSAKGIENKKFSFVHLDVDLYKSTKDCLEFFYPRMTRGGIILTHDYPFLPGVKKAFDDFFSDKPESIIKMIGNQGMFIKVG